MWRWIYIALIAAILAGPVLAIHQPACEKPVVVGETDVSPPTDALSPCQESAEQAKAGKRNSHTSPYHFISPSDAAPWTAVYSLSFLLADSWGLVETAVNAPPNPPPRFAL
jgi:hypothetical protein